MGSDEPFEEDAHDDDDEAAVRPSKRIKVEPGSAASSAVVHDAEPETVPEPDPLEGMSDVSSDTSGDIPSSPINARLDEEDFQRDREAPFPAAVPFISMWSRTDGIVDWRACLDRGAEDVELPGTHLGLAASAPAFRAIAAALGRPDVRHRGEPIP